MQEEVLHVDVGPFLPVPFELRDFLVVSRETNVRRAQVWHVHLARV